MQVRIASALLERIMALAATTTDEICGLLLGDDGWITAITPCANVAPDPSRHFELDPAMLIAAHRAARSGGPAVLGHYHSHPSGVAVPSRTDAACAAPDGNLWLIVGAGEATIWRAGPGTGVNVHFTKVRLDSR